jgi:hypothetical protein
MYPNSVIRIKPNGDSEVKSLEQSDLCYKLKDLAKSAGKVVSEEDKDHVPAFQSVSQKGVN